MKNYFYLFFVLNYSEIISIELYKFGKFTKCNNQYCLGEVNGYFENEYHLIALRPTRKVRANFQLICSEMGFDGLRIEVFACNEIKGKRKRKFNN